MERKPVVAPLARTQTQQSPPGQLTDEEAEAGIAAVLAGTIVLAPSMSPVEAIAALLSRMVSLLSLDLPESKRSSVAGAVARLVAAQAVISLAAAPRGYNVLRAAQLGNLRFRGRYAINAVKRLAVADDFRAELRREVARFEAHRRASEQRERGARLNDEAARKYGPVLGWIHTGKSATHRPEHVRAHGKNYDVRRPPRATGGMLPGMALHCDCVPGPPKRGAGMLL